MPSHVNVLQDSKVHTDTYYRCKLMWQIPCVDQLVFHQNDDYSHPDISMTSQINGVMARYRRDHDEMACLELNGGVDTLRDRQKTIQIPIGFYTYFIGSYVGLCLGSGQCENTIKGRWTLEKWARKKSFEICLCQWKWKRPPMSAMNCAYIMRFLSIRFTVVMF